MSDPLANLVIPTHNRRPMLDATLSSLGSYYGGDAKRFNVVIVDSSDAVPKVDSARGAAWGSIEHVHVPGMHPFRKMHAADAAIRNDLPVIYATDDDIYGYSIGDLTGFARSGRHYSACRHLFFKIRVAGNGERIFYFWKGYDHFEKAALLPVPSERLKLFSGQGLVCFYGLFSREAFRVRSEATGRIMDALGDGPSSSLLEDMAILATLSLSWHASVDSWCFSFIDGAYRPNARWQPSWTTLESLRRDDPQLLRRTCALLAQWVADDMRISGDAGADAVDEEGALGLIESHTRGYKGVHSRKWRSGKDYIYAPRESVAGIAFLQHPQDPYRPVFAVGRPVRLTEIDRVLFEGEWVASEAARSLFNAMSDDFINLRTAPPPARPA